MYGTASAKHIEGILRKYAKQVYIRICPRIEETIIYHHDLVNIPDIQPPAAFDYRIIGMNDISLVCQIFAVDIRQLKLRLDRGDRCYLGLLNGDPVHYSWVQMVGKHPVDDAGLEITINNKELWIYDCRTAEKGRGVGIYPYVLTKILRQARDEGMVSGWIYTTIQNISSQRGIKKTEFNEVQRLRALVIGQWHMSIKSK